MAKVTIMIPTFNQAQYIEQCIASALAQDYPNLEIVVSDDSTTDETRQIVYQKFIQYPNLKYYRNEYRIGRVANYHITLYERATGAYVLNLDGDDWLIDNTYIRKAATILENNPDVVCVMAKARHFHQKENRLFDAEDYGSCSIIEDGNDYLYLNSTGKATFNHLTVLYRADRARQIGFYNKETTWTDSESIFRLICNHRIGIIDHPVGVWRIHGANESLKSYNDLKVDELFLVEESIADYYAQSHDRRPFQVNKWLNNWKYQHTVALTVKLIKQTQWITLFDFLMFLSRKHMVFFVLSLPKLILELSVRSIKYMTRRTREVIFPPFSERS